jgi:hypothetical protein
MSLCGECYYYHNEEGYILYDEGEENKWLGGCEMRQSDGRTMDQKTTYGECSVELLRENPDGSADYQFNFPQEALDALTRLGILTAIKAGIEEAKRLNPDEPVNTPEKRVDFTDEIRHIAEQAGFTFWEDEEWKPAGAIVDWAAADDSDLVKFYHLTRKQAMRDAIAMFEEEHVWVDGRHNYWKCSARMIKEEFLEEEE